MPKRAALKGKPQITRRDVFILALIGILGALVFGLAGVTWLPGAAARSEREIVNDTYDPEFYYLLSGEEALRQAVEIDGRVYGVKAMVKTFGRVASGTLQLDVYDAAGLRVTGAAVDMQAILDGVFCEFWFDNYLETAQHTPYTLVFTSRPATAQDVLGIVASEGPADPYWDEAYDTVHYSLEAFHLEAGGQARAGTIALQYILRYAGNFIYEPYIFFSILLVAMCLALYLCLFVWRAPLHRCYLLAGGVLGLVFLFLVPFRTAPDEYVHIGKVYQNLHALLGLSAGTDFAGRPGDGMILHRYDFEAMNIYSYREVYEGLLARVPDGPPAQLHLRGEVSVFPLMYLPQTLGSLLAWALGLGKVGFLTFGRLGNLAFYLVMTTLAIRRMPTGKGLLMCMCLLPMSLQMAASFCYDNYVNALSFYFFALCFSYAAPAQKGGRAAKGGAFAMGTGQIAHVAVIAALLSAAKLIYVLLAPLVFLIPLACYKSSRQGKLARLLVLGVALVFCAVGNFSLALSNLRGVYSTRAVASLTVGTAAPDVAVPPSLAQEAQGEGITNSQEYENYNPTYILAHIPATVKLLVRSFREQAVLWLQGLVGGVVGEPISVLVEINWLLVLMMLAVLAFSARPLRQGEGTLLARRARLLWLPAIPLLLFLALLAICLMWTPTDYETLFGMQGRYLLPGLPVALFALRGGWPAEDRMERKLAFAMPLLAGMAALDAFLSIIALPGRL